MKQDMELIRKMVLLIEDHPHGWAPERVEIEGYTPEQIGYHAFLMHDAGLVVGRDAGHLDSPSPCHAIRRLTAEGHKFAANARNPHIWDEVLSEAKSKGVASVALDVFKRALDAKIRKRMDIEM